jgi:hypothetical protein
VVGTAGAAVSSGEVGDNSDGATLRSTRPLTGEPFLPPFTTDSTLSSFFFFLDGPRLRPDRLLRSVFIAQVRRVHRPMRRRSRQSEIRSFPPAAEERHLLCRLSVRRTTLKKNLSGATHTPSPLLPPSSCLKISTHLPSLPCRRVWPVARLPALCSRPWSKVPSPACCLPYK